VAPLVAGSALGPYTLVRPLGAGGMGEVWVATGPDTIEVAVKVLPEGSLEDVTARARFTREVEVARSIDHPRVQAVLDADAAAERPWLATELVVGPTLAQRVLADGPLPGPELHALARGLAEALVAVHAAGLVHRDVSPANVVLGPDGPVLVDFGIARGPTATTLTEAGTVVGTAGWLAPEALRDEELTDAADVWSWGLVLAYAATGRPPAAADRVEAVMRRVLDVDLDLRGLPPWLDRLVRRSVERTPARRPTAEELVEKLAPGNHLEVTTPLGATDAAPVAATAVTPHPPPPEEPTRRRRRRPDGQTLVVRGFVVAAGAAFGLVAPPLLTIIVVTMLLLLAIGLRAWAEDRAEEKHLVIGAGTVVLAAIAASLAGLAEVIGLLPAAIVLLVLFIAFLAIGGDVG
jgi:serine/threonine protein kinase